MKEVLKKKIKPIHGGLIVVITFFIFVSFYILLFEPELWDPIRIMNFCILLYLFVLAHNIPDKDAKEKMTNTD